MQARARRKYTAVLASMQGQRQSWELIAGVRERQMHTWMGRTPDLTEYIPHASCALRRQTHFPCCPRPARSLCFEANSACSNTTACSLQQEFAGVECQGTMTGKGLCMGKPTPSQVNRRCVMCSLSLSLCALVPKLPATGSQGRKPRPGNIGRRRGQAPLLDNVSQETVHLGLPGGCLRPAPAHPSRPGSRP